MAIVEKNRKALPHSQPQEAGLKSSAARWGIFAFTLLISLTAVELFLRAGFFQPSFDMNGWKIVLDRKILFKIKPHSGPDINNLGFRGPDISPHSKKPRILFLGDSFVFGVNVDESKTAPAVLQKMLSDKYELINMGIQGYGPDQSLIQLTDEGLNLSPSLVILCIFPANDFSDIQKNQLFEVTADRTLRRSKTNVVEATLPPLDLLYLFQFVAAKLKQEREAGSIGPLSLREFGSAYDRLFITLFADGYDLDLIHDRYSDFSAGKIKLMSAVLHRFKETLATKKIPFLVTILPSASNMQEDNFFKTSNIPIEKYFTNEDVVTEICDKESIPCINFYPLFKQVKDKHPSILFFDKKDRHLNEGGYAFVAASVYEYIQKYHLD